MVKPWSKMSTLLVKLQLIRSTSRQLSTAHCGREIHPTPLKHVKSSNFDRVSLVLVSLAVVSFMLNFVLQSEK